MDIIFQIWPVNDDEETKQKINHMYVGRMSMDHIIDYDIHGSNPVVKVPIYKSFYGLNTNYT
jgi:hypothetical protein